MLQPTFNMKKAFFDRRRVMIAVDRSTRKALSKSLAFIRQTARTKVLKRRTNESPPGHPPSVRASGAGASLRNILFAYDERTKSGVVGPVRYLTRTKPSSGKTVPQVLEFGSREVIKSRSRRGLFRRKMARYEPRPFMGPALKAEMDAGNIISPWANVVSK